MEAHSFSSLSHTARFYLIMKLVSVIAVALAAFFVISAQKEILILMTETLFLFTVVYLFLATFFIGQQRPYTQEHNVVVALLSAVMTVLGLVTAFWLYKKHINGLISPTGDMFVAGVALFLAPTIGSSLYKSIGIKGGYLYLLSLAQIIIVACITWIELEMFFK